MKGDTARPPPAVDAGSEQVLRLRVSAGSSSFVCTQVIGFSQTAEWYPAFESIVDDKRWQLQWEPKGRILRWVDPNYVGWDATIVSPCVQRSGNPDRVVLTISKLTPVANINSWAMEVRATISTIRRKYPHLEQIVLQPVVGGQNHQVCHRNGKQVNASFNAPQIDQAILLVVGGDIVAGASPEVSHCSDYRDRTGHIAPQAGGQPAGYRAGRPAQLRIG